MERHTRSYLQLIKPGITLSNTLTALAGFLLAASLVPFEFLALVGGVAGTAFVIASACVINNILDRGLDARMKRTSKREIASGLISLPKALAFGIVLGLIGFSMLLAWTNLLTFALGIVAYIWYIVIYGIAKRTTSLSTIIGGVPGALPPVAGYTALTGMFDSAAIILFLILFFWQLPHFYAISMFRRSDYQKAGLPVWSVRHGLKSAKIHIFISIVLFAVTVPWLTVFGYTGIVYLVGSLTLAGWWLYKAIKTYRIREDEKWARGVFGVSLAVLLGMCGLVAIGGYVF